MDRPKIPDITEASIMPSFEKSKNWVGVKESSHINSDLARRCNMGSTKTTTGYMANEIMAKRGFSHRR